MSWQPAAPRRPPPVRVDDEVIFWDGTSRKLTAEEIARLDRGEEVIVPKPPWHDWRLDVTL